MNEALFDPQNANLTEKEMEILERMRAAFTIWLDDPMKSENEIRDYLMGQFNIGKAQAYRDITNVKLCLGNIKAAGKEWQRHKANSIIDEAYKAAKNSDHKAAKSLVLIANSIVKINRLDVDEGEQIPWDDVIPQNFEPTTDPTTIGLKPIGNLKQKIEIMKRKYIEEMTIEVPFEESDEGKEKDIFQ
jgi:hypothetical protein